MFDKFFTAIVQGLAGAPWPVWLLILMLVMVSVGALCLFREIKRRDERFDAMVATKDERYAQLRTELQTDLDEAHTRLMELNQDYANANHQQSESLIKVAEALARVGALLEAKA